MSDFIGKKELMETIEKHAYFVHYDKNSVEKGMTVTGIMQAVSEQKTFDLDAFLECLKEKAATALYMEKEMLDKDGADYDKYICLSLSDVCKAIERSWSEASREKCDNDDLEEGVDR